MRNIIIVVLFFLLSIHEVALAAEKELFEIETEGWCQIEKGSSVDVAKKVAFFAAKRKAVGLAGRYFSRKSLIRTYDLNRDEIFSLAANKIQAEILEENLKKHGITETYWLRIRAKIQPSDFVKAEMDDIKQVQKEQKESYQEEMEQPVSDIIDPGRDIARAYRLLREKKWRIAMICLDNLEKKYPNWDRVYMAKAITHYILNEPVFMEKALSKGCQFGNKTACDDLKNIKKLHEHSFGISVIE